MKTLKSIKRNRELDVFIDGTIVLSEIKAEVPLNDILSNPNLLLQQDAERIKLFLQENIVSKFYMDGRLIHVVGLNSIS